jgi:hypothetical protein
VELKQTVGLRPEDEERRDLERKMQPGGVPSTNEIRDLLVGRPGWRLEPQSTPGATPLWCFVFNGKIEYSVTAVEGSLRLYVMETDQEIAFADEEALTAWLRANRAEAMLEPVPRASKKSRLRKLTQWG